MLLGCKKDRLSGETKILEGKWRWVQSVATVKNETSGAIVSIDTIQANYSSDIHEIEFLSKGKIHFIVNDAITEKARLVLGNVLSFAYPLHDCKRISFLLNNRNYFYCFVNSDTLIPSRTTVPLFDNTVYNVETKYDHYFIKVN